ncbi:MAG: alpha/beta hydrolase, partial [Alphaproteobacteria bacterium]|nr:alpha/beta hydrolase [Alphaproteobacteria bacterium]
LLAAAGIHRVAVVGTSLGGLLATGMGAAMPTVLAGVVMNDVGPDVGRDGLGRIIAYLSSDTPLPDWETAVAELQRMVPTLSFRTHEEWLYAAQATWRACDDGMLRFDWDPRIIDPIRDNKPLPDLWPLFRSLRRLPVLAIRGGVSEVLSEATFDRMAREHPNLQRLCLDGVGHAPSLFEPESAAAIDRWLESVR